MQEVIIDYKKMEWKDNPNSPHELSSKILHNEGGARTLLHKFTKCVTIDILNQPNTEQHFIVTGQYETESKIYDPGFYRLIPAGINHSPFSTKTVDPIINTRCIACPPYFVTDFYCTWWGNLL